MPAQLLKGRDLLNKKGPAMRGSKDWKFQLSKALTLAVNSEFREYRMSGGARGLTPELHFHIIFIGTGPFTKCKLEMWLGEYQFARDSNAVLSYDASDVLAGATKNEFADLSF